MKDEKFVYFISNGEFVKIGVASNPEKRLKQLQTANHTKLKLFAFTEGGEVVEKVMHKLFEPLRVRGEWFKLKSPLTDFMDMIRYYGYTVMSHPKWTNNGKYKVPPYINDDEVAPKNRSYNEKVGDVYLSTGGLFEIIKRLEGENEGLCPIDTFAHELITIHKLSNIEVMRLISGYKRQGSISEPKKGHIKLLHRGEIE